MTGGLSRQRSLLAVAAIFMTGVVATMGVPAVQAVPRTSTATPQIAYFGWNFAEGTSQEDLFTVNPVTRRIQRLTNDTPAKDFISDRDPAWSPDRELLAIHRASSTSPESTIYLLDGLSGRTLRQLVPGIGPEWYDGSTVLFTRQTWVNDAATDMTVGGYGDVYAVDTDTRDVTRITDLSGDNGFVDSMSWNPSTGLALGYSRFVPDSEGGTFTPSVVATIPRTGVTAALGGGPKVTAVTSLIPNAAAPDWSPSGDRLAYTYFTEVPNPDVPGSTLLVPDTAVRHVAGGTTTVITADAAGNSSYGANVGTSGPAFSPAGTEVAYTRGYEDEWQEIWIAPASGGAERRITDQGQLWFKGGLDW